MKRSKAVSRVVVVGVGLLLAGSLAGVLAARQRTSHGRSEPGATGAALVITATGEPTSARVTTGAAPSLREDWPAGRRRRYHISITDTTIPDVAQPEHSFSVVTSARLDLTAVEAPRRQTLLRAQLSELSLNVTNDGELARQAEQDMARDLVHPFLLSLNERGSLRAIHAAPEINAFADGFLHALAGALQFSAPADRAGAAAWDAEESDNHGRYTAHYRALSPLEIERIKKGYSALGLASALGGQNGSASHEGHGRTIFTRGDDGAIARRRVEDALSISSGATTMRAQAHLDVVLEEEDDVAVPVVDTRAFLEEEPPVGRAVVLTAAQKLDEKRKLVDGATFTEALDQLRKAPPSDNARRWGAARRLSALFDTVPGSAAQALEQLRKPMSREDADMLLAALSDASSAEAQQGLIKLANDRSGDARIRDAAISHLGLQDNPTADTLKTLGALAADGSNSDVSASATLALGGAIRHVAAGDAEAAQSASESVRDWSNRATSSSSRDDRQLALTALGNAGSADGMSALSQSLTDADPSVRAAAAMSLRFVAGAEAERLLARTLLDDGDASVRRAAAVAISYRPATEPLLQACSRAVLVDQDADVRMVVVGVLTANKFVSPAISALLEQVAASDASPDVRRAALRAVHPEQVTRKAA